MQLQNSTKDQLRAFVARIERLEEEKAALAADLREVYAEAKGNGFDVKALRAVVRIRKQDENKRKEEEAVLVTYLHALGMAEAEAAITAQAKLILGRESSRRSSDRPAPRGSEPAARARHRRCARRAR